MLRGGRGRVDHRIGADPQTLTRHSGPDQCPLLGAHDRCHRAVGELAHRLHVGDRPDLRVPALVAGNEQHLAVGACGLGGRTAAGLSIEGERDDGVGEDNGAGQRHDRQRQGRGVGGGVK